MGDANELSDCGLEMKLILGLIVFVAYQMFLELANLKS